MQPDGSLLPYANSLAEPVDAQEVFMEEAQQRDLSVFAQGKGLFRTMRKFIKKLPR